VLAHPGPNGLAHLPELIQVGLQGIEVFHPSHTVEDVFTLTRLATERNLLITGGSDCHGLAKGVVRLGQARLPLQYVERLRQAVPGPGSPGT
jgi:predicted metal-dependent phosphoesterase TrpH